MKTRWIFVLGLFAALIYPWVAVQAQGEQEVELTQIQYGQSLSGAVPTVDTIVGYFFDGKAGDVVTITLTPTNNQFQPAMILMTIDGVEIGSTAEGVLAQQALPVDGVYFILIGSAQGTGQFTITLKNAGASASLAGGTGAKPAANGRIVFASDFEGNWDIYAVNPDGGQRERLTASAGSEFGPVWSPDGQQIAYRYADEMQSAIYIMNADGSGAHQVSPKNVGDFQAGWSPDGTQLVVSSGSAWNACDLYVMNADGSNRHLLVNMNQTAFAPVWSVDGATILFNVQQGGITSVYSISTNGTGLTSVVDNARDVSVSPSGETLALSVYRDGNWDLYLYRDEQLFQLTQTPQEEARPVWSPDGQQIAFMQSSDGGSTWQILVISLADSSIVNVSNNNGNNVDHSWSG